MANIEWLTAIYKTGGDSVGLAADNISADLPT